MNKRPLCVVGAVFVLFSILAVILLSDPVTLKLASDREKITITGILDKKEQKEDKTILYIKQAILIPTTNSNQTNQSQNIVTNQSQSPKPNQTQNSQSNQPQNIQTDQQNKKYGFLVYLENKDNPKIGSMLTITGSYKNFTKATNKGQFDELSYYHSQEMDGSLWNAKILETGNTYNHYLNALADMNIYLGNCLENIFNKSDASILKAMLLGNSAELDKDIKKLYKLNGITHILVISGFNITILGMGVYKLVRKASFSFLTSFIISAFIMINYSCMTGLGVATIRALIMFLVSLLAKVIGRTYDTFTAISFVSIIMLFINPTYLLNTGFLLSFTAILAINILYPCLQSVFAVQSKIAQGFFVSLSVSVYTFPVICYFYYETPVYAIFLNVIIIPLMDILLCDAMISLSISMVSIFLAKILAIPTILILRITELLCKGIEKLPHNQWIVGQPYLISIIFYYVILHGYCIYIYYCQDKKADATAPSKSMENTSKSKIIHRERRVESKQKSYKLEKRL